MLGYIIAICCMTAWYFLCRQMGANGRKYFLIGTAVLMTLFYGFRGEDVGSDTTDYINMFLEDGAQPINKLWSYMWDEKSPAYVLCEWLFYQILPYPQLWLIATSAFFFFILSSFLEKNSEDCFFSYFIFLCIFGLFQMTGIRQSCAMAVLMLAVEQIKKNNLFKYLLLIGLAYLFHKSALIFLPFYLLGKRRITMMDIPILAVALIIVYNNRLSLFEYIKSFTSYGHYEQLDHGEPVNFSIMIYAATLLSLVLCILLTVQKKQQLIEQYEEEHALKQRKNYPSKRSYIPYEVLRQGIRSDSELALYAQYANAMIIASLFMPFVAINGAMRRIVMYFALFMILLIPKAFREFIDPKSRRIIKLLFGAVLLYLLLSGVADSNYAYTLF